MSFSAILCLILVSIFSPILSIAEPQPLSCRSLDSLLQTYAFRAFSRPKTGVVYDGRVPAYLTGIRVSALRLRTGSMRTRGYKSYKEFSIPTGVVAQPYVERLALVYQNLGNWSSLFYPLPGYTFLAPVLGLLAYNATDLTAENLPELDLTVFENPIVIDFGDLRWLPDGLLPKCVYFGLDGSVEFDSLLCGNVCEIRKQGHFSVVVESTAPSPAPAVETPPPPIGGGCGGRSGHKRRNYRVVWIIVGAAVGGVVLVAILGVCVVCVKKWRHRKKMGRLEAAAEGSVALRMSDVGRSRVPMATETRTRPVLENELSHNLW